MKKFFTVLLSVILVLAFVSTGVFADSGQNVHFTLGSESLELTQVRVVGANSPNVFCVLPEYDFSNIGTTWTEFDSFPLFNGVSVTIDGRVDPTPAFRFNFYVNGVYSNRFVATYEQGYVLSLGFQSVNGQPTLIGGYTADSSSVYLSSILNITLSQMSPVPTSGSSVVYTVVSSTSSNTFTLSLPYGNAMRIFSDSAFTITSRAYTVRDTTYNFQKYVRASDDFSYRVNGTYQGVVQNSSLVGNISLSVYGSDNVLSLLVPWQPTNQNILGRATAYNYYSSSPDPTAIVAVGLGESFLVWYPYYANNQDTSMLNEVPMDMSITIEHSSPVFFMTYPITGNPSAGEDIYISNTSNVSDSGSSQQTDDGDGNISVTFDNAPSAGGNHGQAPINQNNSILGVLSNLQNTLLGLFNKAIDGIHNLISLGSSFLQSVQVMFSWLPGELLVIITSGFVILLTIGVLKTLWR